MNPDEENNNPLNNPADKPAPTSEPETAPEVTESPEISETPETSETLEIPETPSQPTSEPTPEPAPSAETLSPAPTPVSTPQKKSTTTIILLIVVAVLVVVGIVVAVVLAHNNPDNSGNPDNQSSDDESTSTVLVCSAHIDRANDSEAPEDFNSYKATLEAYYNAKGDMISIGFSEDYSFSDEASATKYVEDQKVAYEKMLASHNLSSDPFESSMKSSGNSVSIYHFADIGVITPENAVIFNLVVDEDGNVDTSTESIKETYTSLPGYNYTCNIENAETAGDEIDYEEITNEDDEADTENDEDATEEGQA